jgi:hypothetical protein
MFIFTFIKNGFSDPGPDRQTLDAEPDPSPAK